MGPLYSPATSGFSSPTAPHQPACGLDVGRDPAGLAVQVQVEQVEVVAAVAQQDVEELPVGSIGRALRQPERGAAEHHHRLGVGGLDRLVHHLELGDVLGRGPRPQQADVGGLVVALPVPHPPAAVAHQAVHEPAVGLQVLGRRRRQEVGRLPGRPPRAGRDRDPDLLGPVELLQEGVHGVEGPPAGLRLDLRPVEVDPGQRGPELAELGHELVGPAEQAVADAADDPQPDPGQDHVSHGTAGSRRPGRRRGTVRPPRRSARRPPRPGRSGLRFASGSSLFGW